MPLPLKGGAKKFADVQGHYYEGRKSDDKTKDRMAVYVINEEEAEIVRRIYREFLAGITVTRICRGLEADGIPTKLGKTTWRTSVIQSILTNEKYTGNALLGKTYKPDVLTKYRQKNDGTKAPMYYAENTHPAIISPEMFELAKKEMERRAAAKDATTGSSRFTSKYPFSGLLVCGTCGSVLRRHTRTVGSGKYVPAWGCATRIKEGRSVCDSHHVREDVLERTYTAAIQQITESADEVTAAVSEGAMLTMEPENKERLLAVEQAIIETQERALTLHKKKVVHQITDAEYKDAIEECSQRMKELEAQQAELQTIATRYSEVKAWLLFFF